MLDESAVHLPQFEPWNKYPDLTQDRLAVVADIIRSVRHEAVLLHEPLKGDTNWSLGCRVYERTCFELRAQAPKYAKWFSILPEAKALQFSFGIGSVPFRFYRGKPDDPPDRYVICTFGELHHQQMCLALDPEGFRPPDNVLRFAVETSPMTLEVVAISVVEVDTAGNPIGAYLIPQKRAASVVVTTLQPKPVELEPPAVEPLEEIKEVAETEARDAQKAKAAKTNTES